MIRVIHKRSERAYPGFDVDITRGSPLGNPFPIKGEDSRDEVIAAYKQYLLDQLRNKNTVIRDEMNRIYKLAQEHDVNLMCYCTPKACHGDVIKAFLEKPSLVR